MSVKSGRIDLSILIGVKHALSNKCPGNSDSRRSGPCVHDSLPELTKFYEEHAADRKRFEILSICNTEQEKAVTVEAFDPLAAPLVKELWGGKQLPFLVLIDGEAKTAGVYGIQHWPTLLLIDPEGHLVKNGDCGGGTASLC